MERMYQESFVERWLQLKRFIEKRIYEKCLKSSKCRMGTSGADTYDIWLYKGGASCHHFWMRKTYMAKECNPDATNPRAEVSM
jgi:uncharacterized protein YaeQ